uniref:BTB domain-containing protein n=1 Tax=Kalanchoe fedtschenkoi TaxID=63787 RepID=A0A7N1A7Q3_KALFE
MPPFAAPMARPHHQSNTHKPKSDTNVVTIDVGGRLFQTTKQTLSLAGPKSILTTALDGLDPGAIPFIDRDPDLFSILLSLLRTGNLPSRARSFDVQDLITEARFYSVETLIFNSLSNPSQFEPFNLEKSTLLPLNGRDAPSSLSITPYGSVHVAHGSKITTFKWSLQKKKTILTQFSAVDSLHALSPAVAAAGATDFSGLQIIDLQKGFVKETLSWENATRSSSTVQAIGASDQHLFASFESGRRNSNAIMIYDVSSLRPAAEIAHCEIYGAEIDSAIPATKLSWVDSYNLLMAAGSHSGPSGVAGSIKLWDLRSGTAAWELKEKLDCFADITVADSMSSLFKIGVNSGEVFVADLRHLGGENPWVCVGDSRRAGRGGGRKEGVGCRIESHGDHVFCSKGGSLEMWSEVLIGAAKSHEDGLEDRVFRSNVMGRAKDGEGGKVTNIGFGGNKMFVTRKDQQVVEVWMSSGRRF